MTFAFDQKLNNKISEIQASLDMVAAAGCVTSFGLKVCCDDLSIGRYLSLIAQMSLDGESAAVLPDFEGNPQVLSLDQIKRLHADCVKYGRGLFAKQAELLQRLAQAQTPEEIDAIVW